ncbi:hypothetical protein D3C76_1172350 [compost metagenome]
MMACSNGSWAMANKSSRSDDSTTSATNKTMKNFANALSNSTTAWVENIRLRPDKGFMRLNFGANELPANNHPPREIGPTMAATSNTSNTGCTATSAILPEASRNRPIWRSSSSTSRDKVKLTRINSIIACASPAPKISNPPAPANITASVLSSLERATSPFSRESFLRFSVGSSVLS